LRFFEISAFLSILAWARRAQRAHRRDMGIPIAERYTPSGAASAKEKGALGGVAQHAAG
jgi:hypothetical protein